MDIVSEGFSTCWIVCTAVGAFYLLSFTVSLLWKLGGGIFTYCLAPLLPWGGVDLKSFGSWAVVTGASEGIGRGYALELARRGLNVVVLSRSKEKLEKVAKEIRETHHREALVIPVDFAQGQTVYPRLYEQMKDLEIGVLVNNVGVSTRHPQYLLEIDEHRLRDMIELNCQAMVQMTRLLLPAMADRGSGAIVNISSYTASLHQPLLTVYAATKKFANTFSTALSNEYASNGILVQTVMPHLVSTAMTKIRRHSIFVPSGVVYSKSAVSTVGRETTTYGYWPHAILCGLTNMVPIFVREKIQFALLSYARSMSLQILARRKH